MAVSFVGSDSGHLNASESGTITLTLPTHQTNDFGLIFCYGDEVGTVGTWSIVTATGWTKLVELNHTTGRDRVTAIFYKKFTSGSETNPVASFSELQRRSASVHVFRSVDTTDPWGSASPFYTQVNAANDASPPNASITTDVDNATVVLFSAVTHGDITAAGAPTGYTLGETIIGQWSRQQLTAYDLDVGTSGSISPGDWNNTVSSNQGEYTCYSVALKPAATATEVSAGVDALTLTDFNVEINEETSFTAGVDALTLTDYNVDLNVATAVDATLDALSLTAYNVDINEEISFTANFDALTLTAYNTDVNLAIGVDAAVDPLSLTGYNADIKADSNISASLDALTLTAYNTSVGLAISVVPNVDQLALNVYNTDVKADTTFTTGLDALTLTAQNVSVNIGQGVSATLDQLALTTFNPSLNVAINFTANVDGLTLTAYNADVSFGYGVDAFIQALTLTPYSTTIDYTGLVVENATDDDRRYISDRALRAAEAAYKEYVKIRRQRILNALSKLRH